MNNIKTISLEKTIKVGDKSFTVGINNSETNKLYESLGSGLQEVKMVFKETALTSIYGDEVGDYVLYVYVDKNGEILLIDNDHFLYKRCIESVHSKLVYYPYECYEELETLDIYPSDIKEPEEPYLIDNNWVNNLFDILNGKGKLEDDWITLNDKYYLSIYKDFYKLELVSIEARNINLEG